MVLWPPILFLSSNVKSKRNTNLNNTRLAVNNTVFVPMLLHGSETWVLQRKNEKKMYAEEMRSLCRTCDISVAVRIRRDTQNGSY